MRRGACIGLCLLAAMTPLFARDIPRLDWQERSDWINVKTDVTPAAMGDGKADDTAAIQAALGPGQQTRAVYLPPGRYRITKTLEFHGPALGCLVIGHGRDTVIVWDGEEGGRMFWSEGIAYSRYVGLTWDGRGKAAVGFDHASKKRFETEVRHEHEAFRNFTGFGIRVGNQQKVASAEILYLNCLFEKCKTGIGLLTFNDYDNTIERCEFVDCDFGIRDNKANFYIRQCRFERSRQADVSMLSEHGSSVRSCVSVGSRRFVEQRGGIAPLTIQDCHVTGWQDTQGAVRLAGSPVLMFDCSFHDPPSKAPPVRIPNPRQRVVVSENEPAPVEKLVGKAAAARVNVIPPGELRISRTPPTQRFLRDTAKLSGRIFDAVRDFGAKGDGKSDDTAAIQATIDAAREAGHDALAYLPTGRFVISKTLNITGSDYRFGGSGFQCRLAWRGPEDQPMVTVDDCRGVTLEHIVVGHHDLGKSKHGADILVTSPPDRPCHLHLDEVFGFGMYQKAPDQHGIIFRDLPAGSIVDAQHTQGNLRFIDSAHATILFRTSYEGTITVAGKDPRRDGFLGFQSRLSTISKPTLHVMDNQSIVMTDFYNEQSLTHMLLEGAPGLPPGAITVQGAKMHTYGDSPTIELRNYAGRVYYGQSQFYIKPETPRFVSSGNLPVRLTLAGHFWYRTKPKFELTPNVKLTMLANRELPDQGLDNGGLHDIAAALDDLRRLAWMGRTLGVQSAGN